MTARAGLRALLLLPGLALAAAETAVAEGHSMGTCAAIFDRLQQLAAPAGSLAPPARTAVTPEGCAFTGLHLAPDGPFGTEVRVARLTIGGTGLAAYLAAGTPPVALHLRAEGLRVTAGAGDPVMTYLLAAQSARRGIDAEAKLRRDAADRALALERLTIDLPGDNRVDATARIERVDLSSPAAAQASLGSAVLTRLEATIVSHGLFEDFLLVPLGAALLGATDDPEGEAARLIAGARAALAALPPDSFPDPTRAALDALLADMPNPAGTVTLNVTADPGIGAGRLAGLAGAGALPAGAGALPGPSALDTLFDGVVIGVDYIRSPGIE